MTGASTPGPDAIRNLLRQIVDPELGANIVDLGLIYRIEPTAERVLIEMTLTSPACPMGDVIIEDVHNVLASALPEKCLPEVHLVWEPPWDPSRMSERIKAHFGW